MVANAFQDAQNFSKHDVGFGIANTGFKALDMLMTHLPVDAVEIAFEIAGFLGHPLITGFKGFKETMYVCWACSTIFPTLPAQPG